MSERWEFEELLDEVLREEAGVLARPGIERRMLAVLASDGVGATRLWRAPQVVARAVVGVLAVVGGVYGGWRAGEERSVGSRMAAMELHGSGVRSGGEPGAGTGFGLGSGVRAGTGAVRVEVGLGSADGERRVRSRPRRREVDMGEPGGELGGGIERLEIPALTVRPLGVAALTGD